MTNQSDTVERFMAALDHPRRVEIAAIREAILGADARITEQIKWKAPSFCWNGDDRVTLRLQPKNCLQLIFHRGVKVRDAAGFVFDDPGGLLRWAAPDRGVLDLNDEPVSGEKPAEIAALAMRWMQSTES